VFIGIYPWFTQKGSLLQAGPDAGSLGLLRQGAAHQPSMPASQITPEDIHAAGLDAGAGFFEIGEHTVMDNLFAKLDNVNVEVIQFPELALGQNGRVVAATFPVVSHTQH
jgi:hypothetical protein